MKKSCVVYFEEFGDISSRLAHDINRLLKKNKDKVPRSFNIIYINQTNNIF